MAYGLPGKPGYQLQSPLRLLPFRIHRRRPQRRQRLREHHDPRPPLWNEILGWRHLSRGVGPLRELRLHIAARSSASRARPSRSAPPPSGGSLTRWRSRVRPSAASVSARPAPPPPWVAPPRVYATTTSAPSRRGCWRSASSSAMWPCST